MTVSHTQQLYCIRGGRFLDAAMGGRRTMSHMLHAFTDGKAKGVIRITVAFTFLFLSSPLGFGWNKGEGHVLAIHTSARMSGL